MSESNRITFQSPAAEKIDSPSDDVGKGKYHPSDIEASFGAPIVESKSFASAHASIHETELRKKQVREE
jgi:hypothetical protein